MAEDQALNVSSSVETQVSAAQPTATSATSVPRETSGITDQSTSVTNATEAEKMLPQSKVNEIVGKTRQEERERATREAAAKFAAQQQQFQQSNQQSSNFGGMSQIDDQRARQIFREEAQRQALEVMQNKSASEFLDKINNGKEKYQDFDKVTEDLKLNELRVDSPFIHYINEFDNAADMIYDLGKNPEKLGPIVSLFNDYNLTKRALKKLSDSIKVNESSLKQPQANPPLSHVSPSPTGVDNGKLSVSDLRKQSWLRA